MNVSTFTRPYLVPSDIDILFSLVISRAYSESSINQTSQKDCELSPPFLAGNKNNAGLDVFVLVIREFRYGRCTG
jgi:hypothetical protein